MIEEIFKKTFHARTKTKESLYQLNNYMEINTCKYKYITIFATEIVSHDGKSNFSK